MHLDVFSTFCRIFSTAVFCIKFIEKNVLLHPNIIQKRLCVKKLIFW